MYSFGIFFLIHWNCKRTMWYQDYIFGYQNPCFYISAVGWVFWWFFWLVFCLFCFGFFCWFLIFFFKFLSLCTYTCLCYKCLYFSILTFFQSRKKEIVSSLLTVTCNIFQKALQNDIETKMKKLLILGVYAPVI